MSGRNHAPTLVLLSPVGSGLESWAPLLPQLERFFRVVRLDLPAPGLADDALAVLDSLGLDRAHFAALGSANVALHAAVSAPKRVLRLVLVSVSSFEATLEPARVLAPALLVTSTGSASAPPEQVEELQRQLTGAGLVVHDGGDDFIADQPDDVATTLIEFLRD
ncbi:MAG: alpha/beta fold hydrolase [Steroidobacteraceae bacterium]|jgi:pimeloyl-ACP methyl ester carboxylesterase